MSENTPKIWIDHYDLNLGVRGGEQDTIEDVREVFESQLADAIDRDPKLGEGADELDERGVQ